MPTFLGETDTRRQRDIRWTMNLATFACWMVIAAAVSSLVASILTLAN